MQLHEPASVAEMVDDLPFPEPPELLTLHLRLLASVGLIEQADDGRYCATVRVTTTVEPRRTTLAIEPLGGREWVAES
jgi:hypothetical protein